MNISLDLFNNSLYPCPNVECSIYLGKANFYLDPVDFSGLKLLGSLPVASMDILERKTITLENQSIPENAFVSVKIIVNELDISTKCYWAAYPLNFVSTALQSTMEDEE